MSLKFPGTKFSPCRVQCLDRPNTGVMGCNPALDADAYPVVLSGEGGVVRRVRKLRKTTISFVIYVRLSIRPHGTTLLPPDVLHGILYFSICPKFIEAVQVSLKSGKSNGTLHEDQYTSMILSRWIFRRMRNVSDKVVVKIKTHLFFFLLKKVF